MTKTSVQPGLVTSSGAMPQADTLQQPVPAPNLVVCSTAKPLSAYDFALAVPTRDAMNIVLRLNTGVISEQIRIREINESIKRQGAVQ
jgi:hypothetical protein